MIDSAFNFWFQGRQTEYVLAAAMYIAWVAEEPTKRLKTKLQTFFKKNSANCSNIRVTKQRYAELVQVICKLAKVNKYHRQVCIPVGCVPTAAVAISGEGGTLPSCRHLPGQTHTPRQTSPPLHHYCPL